jgi:predicted lipoprotein with Yx(FWY)xxD motif
LVPVILFIGPSVSLRTNEETAAQAAEEAIEVAMIVKKRKSRRILLRYVGVACITISGLSASVMVNSAGAAKSHAVKGVVVATLKTTQYGTILVSGKTVYSLKPSATACKASCLAVWPEVLLPKGATKATAGSGVSAAKLGVIRRTGGALQVTYAGKALYRFAGDTAPDQVNGNVTDTWGKWSVVVTKAAVTSGSSTTTTTTSPSSGGVSF